MHVFGRHEEQPAPALGRARFGAMVRVYLLGELRLEVDGQNVELPASRKSRLLFAMLALERRAHGRSELAGRLWPDVREDSARASLRNALAQLRGALGGHADSASSGPRAGRR
jgi:DNA-binding SARP family transcriptional activator